MTYEDFSAAVRGLSNIQEEKSIRRWIDFSEECVQNGQFVGFEPAGDGSLEEERWLDILYAGFCKVKESFGQEVADALIGLGRESCCLYPGEMMQAAVCLENSINVSQLHVLIEMGLLDADNPFSPMPRAEAERQMADTGIIPKSALEKGQEKPCRKEQPQTVPGKAGERPGDAMAGWKTQAEVAAIRKRYPIGSRIELDYMNEQGMPPGLKGIVKSVDDAGQLHMIWENGRSLALVPGADRFHRLPELQTEKQAGKEVLAEETEEMER